MSDKKSWIDTIRSFINQVKEKAKTFTSEKIHRRIIAAIALTAVLIGIIAAVSIVRFIESRKPQQFSADYTLTDPSDYSSWKLREPLTINFRASAAKKELVDQPVTEGISISPAIRGTWSWSGDSSLIFTPAEAWSPGQTYTVSFVKDFFPPHIKTNLSAKFKIDDFDIYTSDAEFYIDPENSDIKRVLLTVESNYPMNKASLEQSIQIRPDINASSGLFELKDYQFYVTYNDDATAAYIVSEPVGMPVNPVRMNISTTKPIKSDIGNGTFERVIRMHVEIPGMISYVQVLDIDHELIKNPDQIYEQIFILSTKGTIDQTELIKNLTVLELPKDKPELPGFRAAENYRWRSISDIVPEVIQLSKKVDIKAIPNQLEYNAENSFRFNVDPSKYIYVKLDNKAKFYGGYYLAEPYEAIFQAKDFPREIAVLSEGTILSFSGDKRLAMLSRGIGDVNFVIGRIKPDDINHLISQTYGDMTNLRFRNSYFDEDNITEQYREQARVPVQSARDMAYFSFDFSRYLETIPSRNLRNGLFMFRVEGSGYSDSRLIIVTDLGFYVKSNTDGTRDVFVQSVAAGGPVSGASVSVLGLNGNTLVSGVTGADGHVQIPPLSGYRAEQAPTVFIVSRGDDLSFMPFRQDNRRLDYSSFDVGGDQGTSNPDALRAYIFTDRGLYRPGDEARIGMIVKANNWTINPEGTPLECRITDPRGAEVLNRRSVLSRSGVEELTYSTYAWSPTGTYTAWIYIIQDEKTNRRILLGSQTFKVEEFLPDTLNVSAVFEPLPQDGWINPQDLKTIVTVRNLFGTPARGNEVKSQIDLTPGHQYFRQYRDFTFSDPYSAKNSYNEFLGTKITDDEGKSEFPLDLAKFEKATYNLRFYTEAFEKGSGRNVSAETSVYISPLPYMIGYKADGNLGYIQRDTVRMINLIAIDPKLEKTAVQDITASLTELRYVSALVKQPNGVYKYQSVQKAYPVSSNKISIPSAGFDYSLPTSRPGEYELVLTGPDGLEYNKITFSIAGSQNVQRSLNRTADLEITLNKPDFNPGETIELMIKAPYEGAGLITIEQDKVYTWKWFQSSGETTMQTITVPQNLEGNGYVNVVYLRSQNSREIFMSPLSYGTMPFSISKENRTNNIVFDIPEDAKPGQDFVINYSTSRRGKIIIYAVDEGILQLAGYRTPDPLGFFMRKRALEVRTTQILDLVLPSYAIVRSMAAMGGSEGYDELLSRNLNPFKRKQNAPVAFWSGILDAGPEMRSVSYRVPDYFNGTLRVMGVSVSDDAVGAAEDRALIRSTFILSPNAPMTAAPGDEFEVSLTVTNNQKGVGENGKVKLNIVPSEHFAISGPAEFDLTIPEGRDETLSIPVKASGAVGGAELKFVASNNNETSELSAYMSVRPAIPYQVSLYSGSIKNRDTDVPIPRKVYEEFHTRDVSLSYLPLGLAKGLSFYLNNYPYGCTEQLISTVFPFLYPDLFKDLGYTNRIIGIIQARMRDDNTLGLWTSRSPSDPLVTVYAAHFLTEARENGYFVSSALMNALLESLQTIARRSGTGLYSLSTRAYAIYVLTLNEQVTTPLIETLKQDINRSNAEVETDLPGLYLAGTYAMLQKKLDASILFGKIRRSLKKDDDFRYVDELMYQSLYLHILSKHFPERLRDVSESLFTSISDELSGQRYTSFSANFALMGINSYLKAVPSAEEGNYLVQEILANNEKRNLTPAGETLFSVPFSPDAASIHLSNNNNLNLFYQITLAGFDLELPKQETKNSIEVYREFLDENDEKITSANVGDIVKVKLNFRSLNNRTIYDVALVDMLPAGLEADIESIRQQESRANWSPDYTDIREDRVVFYGTVGPRVSSFVYTTRAINNGTFTVPPLFAEALYDKSIWAMNPQENFTIRKQNDE